MATTRTVRTEAAGLAIIRTKTQSIDVLVIAEQGRDRAELTISTEDDKGVSADIVSRAQLDASGNRITLDVDEDMGGGGMTVIGSGNFGSVSVGRNTGVIVGGGRVNIRGGAVFGSGVTVVNGRVISGGQNVTVIEGGAPITVVVRVPLASSAGGSSQSGGLETRGRLSNVDFSSQSGNVDVDDAGMVNASTMSGNVYVGNLTGTGMLKSMSGNVDVTGPAGAHATASTMSGNVSGRGGISVGGSSMSGSVRVR